MCDVALFIRDVCVVNLYHCDTVFGTDAMDYVFHIRSI